MYIYAIISSNTKIVEDFWIETEPLEDDPCAILVDAVDETWIQRKKYDEITQTFVDVAVAESNTNNSLEYTHIDADGTKHWLDVFVNDLADDVANIPELDTSSFATADHTHTEYAASSHTHTPASIGAATSSHTHSGYAASSHNHDSAYIKRALQPIADNGGALVSINRDDGKNVLDEIAALPIGLHTVYSQSGTAGNPKTTEAWRFMVHKTGTTAGWVQGYGSVGSVYTNYIDGTNGWRGWRCIWDNDPNPLWSGQYYMSSPNSTPQTVTPSKKLSECRTGWLLLWSDYDPGTGANDSDFVTTIIPKNNPSGGTWGGKSFLCDIPRYMGSNSEDVDTERRIIKPIYVHDDCIKGSYQNASDERNDVVLRAVFEI